MDKINVNKPTDLDAVRRKPQSEIQKAESGNAESASKKVANSEDKLEFSNRAAEVGKFVEQVKELPDIRENRIQEVSQKLSNGEFKPSNEDVADAILKEEG